VRPSTKLESPPETGDESILVDKTDIGNLLLAVFGDKSCIPGGSPLGRVVLENGHGISHKFGIQLLDP